MGHNKGWEEAASTFTGSVVELKTCNAALLEATGKSWEEVDSLLFFFRFFCAYDYVSWMLKCDGKTALRNNKNGWVGNRIELIRKYMNR